MKLARGQGILQEGADDHTGFLHLERLVQIIVGRHDGAGFRIHTHPFRQLVIRINIGDVPDCLLHRNGFRIFFLQPDKRILQNAGFDVLEHGGKQKIPFFLPNRTLHTDPGFHHLCRSRCFHEIRKRVKQQKSQYGCQSQCARNPGLAPGGPVVGHACYLINGFYLIIPGLESGFNHSSLGRGRRPDKG
ncbi:hypothetical protein D3C75_873070 [compost metagenome]